MKRFIGILLTAFFLTSSLGLAANEPFPSLLKFTHQKKSSWYFILSAGAGNIKKTGENMYTLNMRLPAINQVTEFTSRPYRTIQYTDLAAFKRLWTSGDNSFTNDPPNAVLSASNLKPEVIVIKHISLQGKDKIILSFQPLSVKKQPIRKSMRDITLVVDTCILDYGDCGQDLSSTSAACKSCEATQCNNYAEPPAYKSKKACLEDTGACSEDCQ